MALALGLQRSVWGRISRDDCCAGAGCFGEVFAFGHPIIQFDGFAPNKWAIHIGLVEPAGQFAAAGTATCARFDEFASATEFGNSAGLLERWSVDDILAEPFQVR